MKNISYTKSIKQNWEIVALLTGIALVAGLVITLWQPFQYKATTKLLIIQNQVASLDAYTATKSAEKIGKNLSQIVSSSTFYNDVIETSPSIADQFPSDSNERRKEWNKEVQLNVIPETGIMELSVYHEEKQTAAVMAKTIGNVLVMQSDRYHGGGSAVSVQVIDDVFVGKFPVRPNVILNLVFALILGFVAGSAFVVLNEAKHASLHLNNAFENHATVMVEPKKDAAEPADIPGFNLNPRRSYQPATAQNWSVADEF